MADPNKAAKARNGKKAVSLGLYDRPNRPTITGIEVIAIALSALWLAGALAFFIFVPSDPQPANAVQNSGPQFLITLFAIFMPIAMFWVAAIAARSNRVMREESQRLQAAIDAIRQAYVAQSQRGSDAGIEEIVNRKLDAIAASARKTETAISNFTPPSDKSQDRPALPRPAQSPTDQPSLGLGTPSEALDPPLSRADFICALNFPETVDDAAGFAALRRALRDRQAAGLIQAAQDILTLLSQDGVYMDDLHPDKARPDLWRRFAKGERGRAVAALGGVRDRSSLALTLGRMKQDAIFRDAAHHFLRRFDNTLAEFEPDATDAELSELSDTRTARAFMLLGRVSGTFD